MKNNTSEFLLTKQNLDLCSFGKNKKIKIRILLFLLYFDLTLLVRFEIIFFLEHSVVLRHLNQTVFSLYVGIFKKNKKNYYYCEFREAKVQLYTCQYEFYFFSYDKRFCLSVVFLKLNSRFQKC